MGPSNACDYSFIFTHTQLQTLGDWIYDGGRVYLAGEYGDLSSYDPCLPDASRVAMNNFLANIGSTMVIGREDEDGGCYGWEGTINPDVPFLENVPWLKHAATAGVTGGTWVAKTNFSPPYVYAAIERIGDGFIFVVGDSNVADDPMGCNYDNCAFYRSFIETPTEEML
jgi:hypothetical protein